MNTNKLLIVVLIIMLFISFLFLLYRLNKNDFSIDSSLTNNSKKLTNISNYNQNCPFECCSNGQYKYKSCNQGYECINNKCVEIDSDSDGISDIKEIKLGTNPQKYDTDEDMLSDYKEVYELKTNPLSKNTDNDRYNDGEDKEPLITNSAAIDIDYKYRINLDFYNIAILLVKLASTNFEDNLPVANIETFVDLKNIGDDYTNYINLDFTYYFSEKVIGSDRLELGILKPNQSKTLTHIKEIYILDIPEIFIKAVLNKSSDYKVELKSEWEYFL